MSRRRLTIHFSDGLIVNYKHSITGHVYPVDSRVQVLVQSDDGLWYLQKDAEIDPTGEWTAECTFGFSDSVHDFVIVAVADATIKSTPLSSVPEAALKSKPVRVVRLYKDARRWP